MTVPVLGSVKATLRWKFVSERPMINNACVRTNRSNDIRTLESSGKLTE